MTDVSSTAPPLGGSGSSGATEQVKEKAQVAQEKVQEGAQQAKGRISEQVDQRSTQAGQQVTETAQALRQTGEQLREQGKEGPAKAAEQAAQRAEQVGNYLSDSSGDRILHDLEDLGRKQPLAAAAVGIAAGFAAARFLKASSQQRYDSRRVSSNSPYGTDGASLTRPTAGYDPTPTPASSFESGTGLGAGSAGGAAAFDPVAPPLEPPTGR